LFAMAEMPIQNSIAGGYCNYSCHLRRPLIYLPAPLPIPRPEVLPAPLPAPLPMPLPMPLPNPLPNPLPGSLPRGVSGSGSLESLLAHFPICLPVRDPFPSGPVLSNPGIFFWF
jgi:hypothetical protein